VCVRERERVSTDRASGYLNRREKGDALSVTSGIKMILLNQDRAIPIKQFLANRNLSIFKHYSEGIRSKANFGILAPKYECKREEK
jgi:hypothetical protein